MATLSLRGIGESTMEILLDNTSGEYAEARDPFRGLIHCYTANNDMDPVSTMDPVDNRYGARLYVDSALTDTDYEAAGRELFGDELFERLLDIWGDGLTAEQTITVDDAVLNEIKARIDALPYAIRRQYA